MKWWGWLLSILSGELTRQQMPGGGGPSVQVQIPLGPSPVAPAGPPPELDESRDLAHAHPELVRRWLPAKEEIMATLFWRVFETCTYRSPRRQAEEYAKGRGAPGGIVTNCDGTRIKSRHNFFLSRALDFAIDTDLGPKTVLSWHEGDFDKCGIIIEKHGLRWGPWLFEGVRDRPHVELPAGVV